jgi:hypothetical protein
MSAPVRLFLFHPHAPREAHEQPDEAAAEGAEQGVDGHPGQQGPVGDGEGEDDGEERARERSGPPEAGDDARENPGEQGEPEEDEREPATGYFHGIFLPMRNSTLFRGWYSMGQDRERIVTSGELGHANLAEVQNTPVAPAVRKVRVR